MPLVSSDALRSWFTGASPRQWVRRAAVGFGALFALVVLLLVFTYLTVSLPANADQVRTTTIRDANGGTLADLVGGHERVDVPLDKVEPVMQHAVVDAEDRHFYDHGGIDPIGMARAFTHDLRGGSVQGGSTITQQLVKNTYLDANRSLVRKVKEAVLSVKLEQRLSKKEILERYLNTIYFGRGAYGIESAAEVYFGVHASELTLPQSALLAGLVRAPELADPTRAPKVATQRRSLVLDAMVKAKAVSSADADAARAAPLGARDPADPVQSLHGDAAYFTAMVEQWAVQRFGEQQVLTGGLHIDTTLDPALETAAGSAVSAVLNQPDDPDAALVSMADDGAVVAMIGGKDFRKSSVNLATNSKRPQAGSTFKPFVLAAALANGKPVNTSYPGPQSMTVNFKGFPPYPVENFNNESFGDIDLRDATAHSVNTVYAQLARDVGLDPIAKTAHDVGIDSEIPIVPSMPLGAANVSPLEMVRAYMTFADRGQRVDPYFVRQVTDADGHVIYRAAVTKHDAYPQKYADAVNAVLGDVIAKGTGTAANIGRPAAGKTGTTSNNTDAWFVGYTPRLGTAVWMGYQQDYRRSMDHVHGIEATGGSFPAQIWQRFMSAAVKSRDTGKFVAPSAEVMSATTSPPPTDSTTTSSSDTTSTSSPGSTSTSSSSTTSTSSTSSTTSTSTTSTTAPTTTTAKPGGGP